MCAHKAAEPRRAGSRINTVLSWLGGGEWQELSERHERSAHAITGVVVVLTAALAGLVTALTMSESVRWPVSAIAVLALTFGALVGAVARAIVSGPVSGWRGIAGRAAVAVVLGVVVGELAAMTVFAGSIDHRLDAVASRTADSSAAVAQATSDLEQTRNERNALDAAVDKARANRDQALVVARCEYHPTPACPQTNITGVPGTGPETLTANERLAATQQELDNAIGVRDRHADELRAELDAGTAQLAQARHTVVAEADRGLAARWTAMHDITTANAGALLLRLVTVGFFILLSLLPLILKLLRGTTTHDRRAVAHAERDHAEVAADTAIAVKRAEVRAAAEILWAEQQLAQARLAVEAQLEIDRANHQRRVIEALEDPPASDPVEEDMYLPIAAEAEAASLAAAEQPVPEQTVAEPENLPAATRATPLLPTIPEVTKTAARWIRPLVPTFVARAIDTTTQPLRTARQVFEEVEEITFSFKRTRKVTVDTEEVVRPARHGSAPEHWAGDDADPRGPRVPLGAVQRHGGPSLAPSTHQGELTERVGPRELPPAE
ncbi:hypothetical protein A5707_13785 [Mycobacterium kyorinense]|uniref:DUF4407 domain-containing protein n=1 Tax=Mycobacterium kyorinense TaxID=487514 RepID=A0A1A2ZQ56_9MYCO|nr:DUF4407 domain-containing protein [Mycobacterium kyorinense]OBI51607.1 hypothetical protein A5707_13785 [Mycobacterium kyorinense]